MSCKIHSQAQKYQLRRSGLRHTPARLMILDLLEHSKAPLSVKGVMSKARPSKTDKVTVYRNLQALVKTGLVDCLDFRQGEYLYELKSGRKHHHHLVCKNCGKVKDVESCRIVGFGDREAKAAGFAEVSGHSLEFFGLCRECKK